MKRITIEIKPSSAAVITGLEKEPLYIVSGLDAAKRIIKKRIEGRGDKYDERKIEVEGGEQ